MNIKWETLTTQIAIANGRKKAVKRYALVCFHGARSSRILVIPEKNEDARAYIEAAYKKGFDAGISAVRICVDDIAAPEVVEDPSEEKIKELIDCIPRWDKIDDIYKFFWFGSAGTIFYGTNAPKLDHWGIWRCDEGNIADGYVPNDITKHFKKSLRERPTEIALPKEGKK